MQVYGLYHVVHTSMLYGVLTLSYREIVVCCGFRYVIGPVPPSAPNAAEEASRSAAHATRVVTQASNDRVKLLELKLAAAEQEIADLRRQARTSASAAPVVTPSGEDGGAASP